MKWTFLLLALLAGCSAHVHVSSGSQHSGISVHAEGGTALAVLLGLTYFTSAYQMERDGTGMSGGSSRAVPELAPDRRISEQDCTKPIDWSLGNIRCK